MYFCPVAQKVEAIFSDLDFSREMIDVSKL